MGDEYLPALVSLVLAGESFHPKFRQIQSALVSLGLRIQCLPSSSNTMSLSGFTQQNWLGWEDGSFGHTFWGMLWGPVWKNGPVRDVLRFLTYKYLGYSMQAFICILSTALQILGIYLLSELLKSVFQIYTFLSILLAITFHEGYETANNILLVIHFIHR